MTKTIKIWLLKLFPLIIIYLLFLIKFIGNSDYESFIVLLAALPLTIYIFTENIKLKKNLQYLLYFFIVGIIIYWVFASYGLIWGIFNGQFMFSGFSCFFTGCYGETGWGLFTQSALFTVDLKVLLYLAVIFLAIKNRRLVRN